jgi:hypothetical protein
MAASEEKPKTWKKKIGEVGVDSGQLMVMDPCYVGSQWINEGEVKAVKFWGRDWEEVGDLLKDSYNREPYEHQGACLVDVKSHAEADSVLADIKDIKEKHPELLVITTKLTDCTYDKCCDLTGSEDKGGQLNYLLGHAGLGVVFSSGFGDGCYDVIAHYRDFEDWGVRVTKVEILLADDEGAELMEKVMNRGCGCSCGCEDEEVPEA